MIALIRPLVSLAIVGYLCYDSVKQERKLTELKIELVTSRLKNRSLSRKLKDIELSDSEAGDADDCRQRLNMRLELITSRAADLRDLAQLDVGPAERVVLASLARTSLDFVKMAGEYPFDELSDDEVQDILLQASDLELRMRDVIAACSQRKA